MWTIVYICVQVYKCGMYSDIVSSDELWAYVKDTVVCEFARVSVCTESIQGNAYLVKGVNTVMFIWVYNEMYKWIYTWMSKLCVY